MVYFLSKKIDSNHLLFLEIANSIEFFHSISTPQKKNERPV